MNNDNVVQFRKTAIFTNEMRHKLTEGIRDQSDKPEEIIQSIENIICTHVVSVVREVFSELGRKLGEKIGKLLVD